MLLLLKYLVILGMVILLKIKRRYFFQRDSIPVLVSRTGKFGSSNCCIFEIKHATGMKTCTKIDFCLSPSVNKNS